jgi:ankyrin repeat protein
MGVKYTDEQKELIAAARTGDSDALRRIIATGYPIDCELKYGSSALTIAASRGQMEAVRVLIEAGAKVNRRNQFGSSPLQEACDRGHQDVIKLLIELGADVNMPHNNGSTVLLLSAMKRDIKTVRLLLAMGADPDIENFEGWSAGRWVKSEANPALLDVFGLTREESPRSVVKEQENTQILEVEDLRMVPSAADGAFWTLFMRAAAMGDVGTLRRLVEDDGVEVNGQSPNGTTALMAAMKNGHLEAACNLIELGADLDITDEEGLTACAWAAKKGQISLLKALQERGLARPTEQGDAAYS